MSPERVEALAKSRGLDPTPKNLLRIAEDVGDELARWAFEQHALRAKATAKFHRAGEMLFEREALEQSTHERVAQDRASRFPMGAPVFDATCGIGGDLIALASRGPAAGTDLDPERVGCANHNLSVYGFPGAARLANCLETPWDADYAMADPARRSGGERTYDPQRFEPSPFVLAGRLATLRLGALKLSPMMHDQTLEQLGPRLEFVEFEGECREAVIWSGSEVRPGRFARNVERAEELEAQPVVAEVEAPARYLFEASPAAIRAHCLGQFGLPALGDSPGYLSSDDRRVNPWLDAYAVLWHGRFDVKLIGQTLRRLDAKTPEIKQRGAKQDLKRLRALWKGDGSEPVVVFLWNVGKSLRAAITTPRLTDQ